MSALNAQVSEVHSIMRRNIQDVLARGEQLERTCVCVCVCVCVSCQAVASHALGTDMSSVSQDLLDKSKQFSWGAKRRNIMESFKKYLPCFVLLFVVLVVIYLRFM